MDALDQAIAAVDGPATSDAPAPAPAAAPAGDDLPYSAEVAAASAKYPAATPEVLHGILHVESRHGTSEDLDQPGPSGRGDGGHGHGLAQIDDRYHQDFLDRKDASGTPLWQQPGPNIEEGARIYQDAYDRAKAAGVPANQLQEVALNGYNHGPAAAIEAWRNGDTLSYAGQVQDAMPEGAAPAAAPGPSTPQDPLDAAIAKVDGTAPGPESAGPVLAMKAELAGPDASRSRDVLHYADLYGVQPEVIERNLDYFKAHADETAHNWLEVARSNPALASWALDGHGLRAGAVKDDLRNLSNLEWSWKAPLAAFKDAAWMLDADARQAMVARGWAGPESKATADQIAEEHSGLEYGDKGTLGHAAIGLGQALPWMAADEVGRLAGGVAGRVGGAVAGSLSGPEGTAAGAAAGAMYGQFGGSFAVNDTLMLGQLNRQFSQMRDADGNPLDPQVAHWAAEVTAGLTSTAMAAMGPFGSKVGKVAGAKALGAVQKLLLEPGLAAAVARYGARFGTHELSAMALGMVQGGLSGAGREGAKLFSGQRFQLDPGSILDDAFHGATNMARDMLLLSGANAGIESIGDGERVALQREVNRQKAQATATTESAARLQGINDAAAKSASIPGLPAKDVDDLVGKITADPATSKVYVDREAVARLAQERNIDPAELAKDMAGDDGSAWENANRTGGELEVPAGPYVRFAAKDKEGAGALFQDARLFSEAQTPRQARAADEKFQKDVETKSKVAPEEMEAPQRAVYDDYYKRGIAGGRGDKESDANARIVAATFHTWAEKFRENGTDTDAHQLYRNQDVTITGPGGRTLQDASFNHGANVEPKVADDPAAEHDAVKELREEYGGHLEEPDTEVAQRRYYTDPVTGLRNERAAALAPKDQAKPAVLHFGVEGVKYRNDDLKVGGHNKADQLLRAVAQAAHQVDPGVYRAGGDFAVPVKDEAEGEAFLQLVRENMPAEAKGYGISGKVGPDLTAARTTHDKFKEAEEKAGRRSERGNAPMGLPAGANAGTAIPGERVKAELTPEHAKDFEQATSTEAGREQVFKTIHVEKSGILTRQGFDARPPKKFRAAIDLNGLKRVQLKLAGPLGKELAHKFGDEMLEHFGALAHDAEGLDLDFAHDHGDEYLAQSDSREELEKFFGDLTRITEADQVRAPDLARGGTWTYKALRFGFGIGEAADENAAERDLNKHKDELAQYGLRGNEDQPGRLDYEPPGAAGPGDAGPSGAVERGHQAAGSGDVGGGQAGGSSEAAREASGDREARGGAEEGSHPGEGAGVDEGGGPGGDAERPLDVAPGVDVHGSARVPTEADMAEADAFAARLGTPERRKAAAGFLDRVRTYLAGGDVGSVVGNLPRDIENELASRFGIVDPKGGYATTTDLQHLSRGGAREKTGGRQTPAERAKQMERRDQFDKNMGRLEQPDFTLESKRGRGEINFTPPGTNERRSFNIRVLSGADTSTLAHETFHFLNQVMGDLAQRPDAPKALKDDYAGLLKFMGYDDHAQRIAETKELADLAAEKKKRTLTAEEKARENALRAKEERATNGWEKFLQEGRSPSVALAGTFQRFSNWLGQIYRKVSLDDAFKKRFGEDLGMTDEVRGIFGRIVAAEDEVQKAAAAAKSLPNFGLFEGATQAEKDAYADAKQKELSQAETEVIRRMADAKKQENNDHYRGERERLGADVNAAIDRNPTYRAIQYLRDGELPGGKDLPPELLGPDGKPYKLDRRAVVDATNKDFVKSIVKKHGNLFAKKGEPGVPADLVADLLGFDSGEQMLRSIEMAENRKALADRQTEQKMTDLHGAALADHPQALGEAAIAGLHNPEAVRAALLERRRLAKMLAPEEARKLPPLHEDTLKATAKAMVAKLKISDLIGGREGAAGGYRRNEAAAADRMRRAFEAGKVEQALGENEARLLNMFLWREAHDAREKMRELGEEMARARDASAAKNKLNDAVDAEREKGNARLEKLRADAQERLDKALQAVKDAKDDKATRLREAREAREHFESLTRQMKQASGDTWRAQVGKADVAAGGDHVYRDAHDGIMQSFGFQDRDPAINPQGALDALLNAVGTAGIGFDVPGLRALLANPKPWSELTPAEAENVRDAVKNIRHAANQQNSLEMEGKRQSMEVFFDTSRAELAGLPKAALERMDRAREGAPLHQLATLPRRVGQWVDSNLMNIETLLDVLTGNNRDSVLHKLFIDGQLKARDAKEKLGREFLGEMMKHWEQVPAELKKRLNEVVDISALAQTPKFQELAEASGLEADGKVSLKYVLMMALNMGNEGNKQRLLDGYGWTEDDVMKHLDRILPKEGWDWVQSVWNSLNSLWPHLARVHELETGVEPGKVEPTVVHTRHGDYPGGYFPAKYDPRTNSRLAQHQVAAAAANMLAPPTYGVASVAKGHTQQRATRFEDAIDLDWNVVPGHVANVLHYIAYRPWIRDAAKVVASPDFATLVDRHLGKEYTKQFDPWLKAVANMQADSVPANQTAAARAVGWMRSRIAVAKLGLSLPIAATHASYPVALATTGEVRPGFMAEATARTLNPFEWNEKRAWALDQSPELRFRAENVGGMMRKHFDEMGAQGSPLQRQVEHMSFAFLEWAEKLTATPAWIARYNQELAGNNGNHAAAVREADSMIRRWYISKSAADVPAIIRDKGMLGGMFMFYGYMNKMENVQRRWARDFNIAFQDESKSGAAKGASVGKAAAVFAGKVLALTLTQGVMSEYLGGKGREDDETWPGWLFRKSLVFQASLPPFLGEAVDSLLLHKKISERQSPGLATTQHIAQTIGGLVQGVAEHDKDKEQKAAWDALEQLGIFTPLTPLPTSRPVGTAKYLSGIATGDQHPRGPLDVAGGVVYGPPHKGR